MLANSMFMRFPNGLAKALTLSYDDGVEEDIRLIGIMRRHGLCGTFNINTSRYIAPDYVYPPTKMWGKKMTVEQATALYSQDGIEPALHGLTHASIHTLPKPQIAYEVLRDRENLEAQFGRILRGMAYPNNSYSDDVVRVLEDCGVLYARTTDASHSFAIPADWLRLPPTCEHIDPLLPELTRRFLDAAPTIHQESLLFYLWGHSYTFERDGNWEIIERFAEQIGDKDDIWYATNTEIFEYIEDFHRLIFNLDMTLVKNPTARTLWFVLRGNLYHVGAGETLKLN